MKVCLTLLLTFAMAYGGTGVRLVMDSRVDSAGPGIQSFSVAGVALSVDRQVAICLEVGQVRRLVLLSGAGQHVADPASDGDWQTCSSKLRWSPAGDILAVESASGIGVFSRDGVRSCLLPISTGLDGIVLLGWVDRDRFALATGFGPGLIHGYARDTVVRIYDATCSLHQAWTVPGRVYAGDASPMSGEIGMQRRLDPIAFLDTRTGAIRQVDTGESVRIGDGGRIACFAGNKGTITIRCYRSEGGRPPSVATFGPRTVGMGPIATVGTRQVVLEVSYSRNLFSESEKSEPRRWIIWDCKTGDEVAQLKVQFQSTRPGTIRGRATPFLADLSPAGDLLVLAGDDRVLLYEIPDR